MLSRKFVVPGIKVDKGFVGRKSEASSAACLKQLKESTNYHINEEIGFRAVVISSLPRENTDIACGLEWSSGKF